jgi:hypothetical protein
MKKCAMEQSSVATLWGMWIHPNFQVPGLVYQCLNPGLKENRLPCALELKPMRLIEMHMLVKHHVGFQKKACDLENYVLWLLITLTAIWKAADRNCGI